MSKEKARQWAKETKTPFKRLPATVSERRKALKRS